MSKQTTKNPSPHRGHRARMRKRFAERGGRDFSDHELLEMLLYNVIPRADTNMVAHALIHEFGSLRAVLTADPARVREVVGAGRATADFLSLLVAVKKRADSEKYYTRGFVADSLSMVGNFFVDKFRHSQHEEFCAMMLDGSLKVISRKTITGGGPNSAPLDLKELTRYALICNATHVILAHNHPDGVTAASSDDRKITADVESALAAVGITLLEHLIVNGLTYQPSMYMKALGSGDPEFSKLYKDFFDKT